MKLILVIEDNNEIRETTSEILELASYKVISARNGKEGIELARREKPDLIICDIMMPEMDGFGVLHVLNKDPHTTSIPFIFLTAKSEREDIRKGMNMGADDYLPKPFEEHELLNAIESRLKKNENLREEFNKDAQGLNEFLQQAKGLKELENFLEDDSRMDFIKRKHTIFKKGGYPDYLYFINKGKVKTFKVDNNENELITGLYKEGDFLGYLDLLEDSRYTENAVALEDSEVCKIKRDDFFALIHKNVEVANKFIRMLSDNMQEREERLLRLAYSSVRKRVAEALLLLQKKYKVQESNEEFGMNISRDDLSGLVGAAKENVIRTLSDFKEEGLIQVDGKKITLINPEKLKNIRN